MYMEVEVQTKVNEIKKNSLMNFVREINKRHENYAEFRKKHYSEMLLISKAEDKLKEVCKKFNGEEKEKECNAVFNKLLEDLELYKN